MFRQFMENFRQPKGLTGALVTRMMNVGHGAMTGQVLERLALEKGDTVLDIGCGGGGAIARMAALGATVYGIDYSPVSVRTAERTNRAAIREGRVRIQVASVDDLPFSEAMFDWVTAFETVYFWKNIQDNFSGVLSVLKPGGHFAIAVDAYMEDGEKKNSPSAFDSLNLALYSAEALQAFAESAGFEACASFKGAEGAWLCFTCRKPIAARSPN